MSYERWLKNVNEALSSINMSIDDWQKNWPFDFQSEFRAGTDASQAALKANKYWWLQQNKSMGEECLRVLNCWLPRNHRGDCEPYS